MQEALYEMYSTPQVGGDLTVFSGSRRHMKGAGFFSTLARVALPIIKNIGKRILGAGVRGATKVLAGEPILQSFADEFVDEGIGLAKDGVSAVNQKWRQKGRGIKRKKMSINNKQDLLKHVKKR